MVKQWHNTRIVKKPFNRYNPSINQEVASSYRPWFLVVGIFCILLGIAVIGVSATLKAFDGDLSGQLFQIWSGIPLLLTGILALIPVLTRKKYTVVLFLVVAVIVMVVCASGSIMAGLRYWMDNWRRAKLELEKDNTICGISSNLCICENLEMPANIDSCDDLKTMTKLVISLTALVAGGFIATLMGIYLSFMAICCAPWMYAEWYDEQYDPDFNSGRPEVIRHSGNVNYGIGVY